MAAHIIFSFKSPVICGSLPCCSIHAVTSANFPAMRSSAVGAATFEDVTNTDNSGVESLKFKVESDGQSDTWYDLVGRRLLEQPTQKGVYLRNRQKVLVE